MDDGEDRRAVNGRSRHEKVKDNLRRMREKKTSDLILWTTSQSEHDALLGAVCEWLDEAKRPEQLKARAPRNPIMQRRLMLKLAHELTDELREDALRAWCEENLEAADIPYHACIHVPENNNDARNYHAHVVYAQFALERKRDARGWTFEDKSKLPKSLDAIRTLSANGRHKRKGRNELIRTWRAQWAACQETHILAQTGKIWFLSRCAKLCFLPKGHKENRPELEFDYAAQVDCRVSSPSTPRAERTRLADQDSISARRFSNRSLRA